MPVPHECGNSAGALLYFWFVGVVLVLSLALVALIGGPQAAAQGTQSFSHAVIIASDPPGAMIWKKEGRDLICTGILTPGRVELKFYGVNDLQKLRLRKFGYGGKNLDVRPDDERVYSVLGDGGPVSFSVEDGASAELTRLNAGLQKEVEKAFLANPELFRCTQYELNFIRVMHDEETNALGVVITLDRSFGGPAFRLAGHASNAQEGHRKMAQAALEGGIADLLAWFRGIAIKFPAVQNVIVLCTYSTTEASLGTDYRWYTHSYRSSPDTITVRRLLEENTVVNDNPGVGSISFAMPVAHIPGSGDTKAVTDSVLADGKITFRRGAQ